MKRTLSFILAAVMVLGMLSVIPMTGFATDPTTPAATAVKTEAEFLAMDPAGNYYLDADITLTKTYGLPEGEVTATNLPTVFTGTLDGNGKTVTISTNAMFAEVKDATISNLTVNGDINATAIGYRFDSDGDYSEGKIKLITQDFFAAVAIVADGKATFKNIVSNVNFTSTLENSRWGAIAAESRVGHELLIENCISNGKIEANSYVGGIYGWCASLGNSTIRNCINTGDIHITAGYCGGITSRLGGSGEGGHLTVEGCVNTGNITADASNASGIVQYSNTFITMRNCVNTGDITASGNAAGIHSSLAEIKADGENIVEGCINTGKITCTKSGYVAGIICNQADQKGKAVVLYVRNNINLGDVEHAVAASNHVAGIIAYVYGTATCYAVVENNINYGKLSLLSTGSHFGGQILTYTNSVATVVKNNIAAGSLTGPVANQLVFIGLSSADIQQYTIAGNYEVENSGVGMYSYATSDANAANRVELTAIPAGALTIAAADKFANGEVATALNTAVGSTMFEVRDGKTLLVCDHTKYPTIDGKCAACGYSEGVSPIITTEAEFLAMDPEGSYSLGEDITLTQTYAETFKGTFDGKGKTVTITNGAMFNTVENANISNFTVKGDISTAEAGVKVGSEDFAAAVAVIANGKSSFKDITSNVNFTTTSANTRYGAIAATSAADYDISVVNCVNNGNITVVKYAGGVYGWSAKVGKGYFKNCVNNGAIVAEGYAGGIVNRLANSGGNEITLTIENCINKGAITGSYGGGMVAYANTFVQITGCVNYADITAVSGGSTGGIAGNLDKVGAAGNHIVKNNINYGNVTNTAEKNTGGIVGYVYGSTDYGAIVENNINFGTVSSAKYCSQILGYTNSNTTVIKNNVGAGKLVGGNDNTAVFVGLSSADISQYTVLGNYYVENDGTKMYSYADSDSNSHNRVALDARPDGSVTFVAADKINGEVAALLNTAIGSNVFEIREGKIALICSHDYPKADGKCMVCQNVAGTIPELPGDTTTTEPVVDPTTPSETTTDTPVDPTTPSETTTAAHGTTEPIADDSCAGCGGFGAFAALLAIVCGAAVVIIKKKA